MKLNILEKSILAAAILGAIASCPAHAGETLPDKAATIEKTYGVKFMGETTSQDGQRIWWRFAYYNKGDDLLVPVCFPADAKVETFASCVIYASEALRCHIHHKHPEGYSIDVDIPVLDQILSNKSVTFLGVIPAQNGLARWVFMVAAIADYPATVVNVAPGSTMDEFCVAYTIANRAIRDYEQIKEAQQKEKETANPDKQNTYFNPHTDNASDDNWKQFKTSV